MDAKPEPVTPAPSSLHARFIFTIYACAWIALLFALILPLLVVGHLLRSGGEGLICAAHALVSWLDHCAARLAHHLN